MEFHDTIAKKRKLADDVSAEEHGRYPTRLQLYELPPVETIDLLEFEGLAVERQARESNVLCELSAVLVPRRWWGEGRGGGNIKLFPHAYIPINTWGNWIN